MTFTQFIIGALGISLSGVMAPGPMTAVTLGKGNENPHAGAFIALGHGIVEFPLMAALIFGFNFLLDLPHLKPAIGIAGGAFLLYMSIGMFRGIGKSEMSSADTARSPILAGVFLSIGNPYFVIWWVSIGAALIIQSTQFGIWGIVGFMVLHWSCDFIWYYFLSALSFHGGEYFGKTFQKVISGLCGAALVFFGMFFIIDSLRGPI